MITNLNPSSALFLANLNRIEQSLADANSQITSGKKINVASDAPDQVESLLQLRTNQEQNTQIQANLVQAKADATGADDALTAAIQLMDRAVTLATQGANSTTDAQGRQSIALEIQAIQEQMVSYSNTQVQGRYIFGGDQDSSPSYQLDLTATTGYAAVAGVDRLSSAASTRKIQDPAGGSFNASQTAQQIFDAPGAGVFAALNGLRQSLLSNNQTGIGNSISALQAASSQLNTAQAFYGNLENRIQSADSFSANYDTQITTQISQIQDADVVKQAMLITQSNTELQAAFETQAKMPTQSLFNYLG
jgi:flagellar hook-associated protein 3 FlgL